MMMLGVAGWAAEKQRRSRDERRDGLTPEAIARERSEIVGQQHVARVTEAAKRLL